MYFGAESFDEMTNYTLTYTFDIHTLLYALNRQGTDYNHNDIG